VHLDRVDVVVIVAVVATALVTTAAALALGQDLVALLFAALATVCVTAITHPRVYRLVVFVGIFAFPFVVAMSLFRSEDYNWTLYLMALALAIVGLGVFQQRAIPLTRGTLYLSYIVLSAFIALWLRNELADLLMIGDLVFAFAIYILVRRADALERRVLLGAFLAFATAQAVIGAMQSWFGWPRFPLVLEELLMSPRNYFSFLLTGTATMVRQGSGTFHHFNGLGSVLALALPLAFGWWLQRLASPWRIVVTLLITIGLVTTYSRGALAGALIGCLFVMAFQRRPSRRVLGLLVGCVGAVVLLLALNTAAQYYETTQNVTVRVSTWEVAVNSADRAPSNLILGFGYGHFQETVLSTGDLETARRSGTMAGVHSGPLQLFLEFGVVGVILFVLWLLAVFRSGLGPRRTWLSIACLGGVLAFLCHQSLDAWFFEYPGTLMVVLLALCEAECDPEQGPAMARSHE
jgi:O-antigen ligase